MARIGKAVIFIVLLSFIIACVAYPFLPDQIPIHWDINGDIDSMQNRIAIFYIPIILAFVIGCFYVSKKIDPKKKNYEKFSNGYQAILIATSLLLVGLECITIIASYRPNAINIPMLLTFGVGALFVTMGNIMPKIRENYFVGIRTPWTLSDGEVWRKTHRLGGRIYFVSGFCMILGVFLPQQILFIWVIIIAFISALAPMVYSYIIFKRKQGENL